MKIILTLHFRRENRIFPTFSFSKIKDFSLTTGNELVKKKKICIRKAKFMVLMEIRFNVFCFEIKKKRKSTKIFLRILSNFLKKKKNFTNIFATNKIMQKIKIK